MPSRHWIKLWIELLDDPKMGTLPHWVWRRFIEFCLIAGENGQDGLIQPVPQLAWRLRISEKECEESIRALSAIGVLVAKPDGYLVVNFTKRQAKVEPKERMRQYRDREAKQQYYDDSYEDVTKRNTDKIRTEQIRAEVDDDNGFQPPGPVAILSETFVNVTQIPELTGGAPKWIDALKKMAAAGITPDDLRVAVGELRNKNYQITGPWSCVNAAITVMSRRLSGNDHKPLGLTGPHGEQL